MAAALDPTTAPDDARVDSGLTSISVVPRIHLRIKTPTDDDLSRVEELRAALRKTHFWAHPPHREWLTDRTLLRFLIAREFNVDKALEMLHMALTWRGLREPYTLRATMEEMQFQGQTGKIYNAGTDRWGRPVVIFNNSVNNSNDPAQQMRYLAFNLETALRKARASERNVSKFVIFMHMYDFSLFNSPPFKVTRETIQIVTSSYPESMGHCVIYQPPYVFSAFYDSVKRFIDKRTASKIVMLTGDVSEGSPNDLAMRELIGDDWQALTGVNQPRVREGCSPGFDVERYWPGLVAEEARLLAWEQREAASAAAAAPAEGRHQQHHHGHSHHHRHRHRRHSHSQATAPAAAPAAAPAPAPTQPQAHLAAAATPVGRGPLSRPPSPEDGAGAGSSSGEGAESKLWRPQRQNSLASVGMVAAASLLSAAAAALSVRGAAEQQDAGAGGSVTRGGLARGGGGGSPLSLAAVLASSLGFAPTAAAGSSSPVPFSMPPGLRWLVPAAAGADDDEAIPGEGLVLLALGLLGLSLLCAYPNQYLSWCVGRLWRRGGGGQAPGEPRPLSPLPAAPTKAVVTAGRVLSEEARRRR